MTTTTGAAAAADELRARLRGQVVVPTDAGYDGVRTVWNGAIDRRPDLIARCRSAADVRATVLAAREHDLPLTVRGGGHDWAGRGVRDGGVLLDLSTLRGVTIDPVRRIAQAAGGATVGDLVSAAAPYGLAPVTGTVSTVGMAGLTLAGGYGPLCGLGGLALDALAGADVVLADGTPVVAGTDGDGDSADLMWGLRGGGGNLGVVTAARYRLLPVPMVTTGMIFYPAEQAAAVFAGHREVLAEAPDELTVMTGFMPGPAGLLAFVSPVWSGPPGGGDALLDRLGRLGTPVFAQVGPMPFRDAVAQFDQGIAPGNHWSLRGRMVAELTPDVAAALAAAAERVTSPFSLLAVHHFHGAASRVPVDATAFGVRTDHLLVEVLTSWDAGDERAAEHLDWADATAAALDPYALPGGYVNLLGPDDTDRVRAAYGPNLDRLLALKRRYDPDRVLSAVPTLPG